MKKTLLLANLSFCIIFLVVKTNAQAYHASLKTPKTFSQLPLVNTNKVPDLFFAGDSIPHNFIKTHIVELYYAYQASSNDLIKGIRKKGMEEGVDGILMSGIGDNAPGSTSYSTARVFGRGQQQFNTDYITTSNGYASIKGIGIKYVDRIDYLDTIIKQRQLNIHDVNGNANNITLNYNIDGRLMMDEPKNNERLFADSIMPFDIQMALNFHSNLYEANTAIDENTGLPVLKKISAAYGYRYADYHLSDLENKKTFRAIVFNSDAGTRDKYRVEPTYNSNNILISATVFNGDKTMFQIAYTIGLKNRVESEDWQLMVDGKLQPWLHITDSYYTNDTFMSDFK